MSDAERRESRLQNSFCAGLQTPLNTSSPSIVMLRMLISPVIRLRLALPWSMTMDTMTLPEVSPLIGHWRTPSRPSIVRVFLAMSTAIETEYFSFLGFICLPSWISATVPEQGQGTQAAARAATAADMARHGGTGRSVRLGYGMGKELRERVARKVARPADFKAGAMPRKALGQMRRSGKGGMMFETSRHQIHRDFQEGRFLFDRRRVTHIS
jgi:hypothetical protein